MQVLDHVDLAASRPPSSDGKWELPILSEGQRLDLKAIRDPFENFYAIFVYIPTVICALILVGLAFADFSLLITVAVIVAFLALFAWIGQKWIDTFILGHSIRVGPAQYPQIHSLVIAASEILGIEAPIVLILQGHGLFEALVAKRFSRRGRLMLTSNLLDDLTENGSSRELMFFIGRQLGLIATGYFNKWTVKHILGSLSNLFYLAWKRHAQMTADRIGLLVAGDPEAAERALEIITVGSGIAMNTRIDALKEQRTQLFDSFWGMLVLGFSDYPYMVDRIIKLREFAFEAQQRRIPGNSPVAVGALPIKHRPIRALPIVIVHGHDLAAKSDLQLFLYSKLPHVEPIAMIDETDGANTLPEKFERIGRRIKGALILMTPDDRVVTLRDNTEKFRMRQNVVFELGQLFSVIGRNNCLLLARGDLEMPSDISGVEVHRFENSPTELSEAVRDFVATLELR